MPGKVSLRVSAGPLQGESWDFEGHDTFIFGRHPECHAHLPADDLTASRHHFIIEVNPPDIRVRDLGSLNGISVNDRHCGGRASNQEPGEVGAFDQPEVALSDGDRLHVGETVFEVSVEVPDFCAGCGVEIPPNFKSVCIQAEGDLRCPECAAIAEQEASAARAAEAAAEAAAAQPSIPATELVPRVTPVRPAPGPTTPQPAPCAKCGRNVRSELATGWRGDYVCIACRQESASDPLQAVAAMGGAGPDAAAAFPGYRVLKKLGEGGMGAVYLACRESDGLEVAIKVMLAQVAVDQRSRDVFEREIDRMASVSHPNLATLFEHGSARAGFFFVMEYCKGGSLIDLLRRRKRTLGIGEAGAITLQCLDGLTALHTAGNVHRDIKPPNILLTDDDVGIAKIADFGLAKNFEEAGLSGMTVVGTAAGTPQFMAREQLIDFRYSKPVTDVWAMAATLYFMLTGQFTRDFPPGSDPVRVVLQGRIVPILERNPAIPRAAAEVIDKALAAKISDRIKTSADFRNRLARVL